jgi:hypothetical protein
MSEQRDYTKERDERVIPVARELLQLLASNEKLPMGAEVTTGGQETVAKECTEIYQKTVIPLLLEKNLKLDEISYLFSIMQQGVHLVSEITLSSLEMNKKQSDAIAYEVGDIDDLTIGDIDAMLKSSESVDNSEKDELSSENDKV